MRTRIDELCRELVAYLLIEEESDSGRVFYPNVISSVRVLHSERMNEILRELKKHEGILRESL
jgi:hypothetical protein